MSPKKAAAHSVDKTLAVSQSQHKGFPASGCWINLFNPIVGELIGLCGYDYAMVDMEHSPVALEQALTMIRAVQSSGAKAIVRAPDKQPQWVSRLMDMGADGVMVPMVNTADEARAVAAATRYAPNGTRGMAASLVRAADYGVSTEHYLQHYRNNFLLLVQIETADSVAVCEDIAAVDGVDCIFIGPFDLAGSLGNTAQPDHKTTRAAIRTIGKATRQAGKLLSTLTTPAAGTKRLLKNRYDLVFSGSDISLLREALQRDAAQSEKCIAHYQNCSDTSR